MKHFPIFLDLQHKHCLIFGDGAIALRKANLLHKAGATISVVSSSCMDDLLFIVNQSGGQWITDEAAIQTIDWQPFYLIIAASSDSDFNLRIASQANAANKLLNVVEHPELSNFILPSIIDRSPITIAVSSGGAAPVLVRLLKSRIESMVPAAYGVLASFTASWREKVKQSIPSQSLRRRFWQTILEGVVAEKVMLGKQDEAEDLLQHALLERQTKKRGEVALVGAGPGDPDLLTFKALRLLQQAEVVLYDRLVAPAIMDMVNVEASLVYVGKARSNHAVAQEQINQLLINYASAGHRVVRLKGGDPFIFGRGGEEIEGLAEHNIAFQVVPGVTAAAGCASYAGIPLTHRDYAQSVRFVTGHLKDNSCNLPWQDLVSPAQTVVFYMGLMGLAQICAQLIAHGREPDTPIALIQKGTTADQKTLIATLSSMPALADNQKLQAPTLIIVGEVVNLHHQLNWFNTQTESNPDV